MTCVSSSAPAFPSSWHTAGNGSTSTSHRRPEPRQRSRSGSHAQTAEVCLPFSRGQCKAYFQILMHTEQLLLSVLDLPGRAASHKGTAQNENKQTQTNILFNKNATMLGHPSRNEGQQQRLAWLTMGCVHHYLGQYLLSCLKYKGTGSNSEHSIPSSTLHKLFLHQSASARSRWVSRLQLLASLRRFSKHVQCEFAVTPQPLHGQCIFFFRLEEMNCQQ